MADRIVELIREYRDCQDELDVFKVANEIREIAHKELIKDLAIAGDEEDYFIHSADLVEK